MRIRRYERGRFTEAEDSLATEEPLAIVVDGRTLTITMRTPGHDEDLALGFLVAEGIIRRAADVGNVEQAADNRVEIALAANVRVDFDKLTRHVFGSSSCGLCGKTAVDRVRLPFPAIGRGARIPPEVLLALPEALRAAQPTFARTGGLHAAALFTADGDLFDAREDIGRHNAVDKLLGVAFREGLLPLGDYVLMVSGRTSFEILQKALAGGVPIVAGVSAPSSLAATFAAQSGQTLVGFLRDGRFNVYAGAERIGE